jgi:thioester reductase-like protein
MLPKALFHGLVPILGPSGTPVNAEFVDAMHRVNLVEISIIAPSILQDIAASPEFLKNLGRLSATLYGGGPLPSSAGNAISFVTRLYNLMGGSEMWNLPTEQIDREDWEYLRFSPLLGYQMRQHSEGLYELGLLRAPDLSQFQAIFSTFPDHQEYLTSDLYIKHPTKPDLWKYSGRKDDIITLTNGEKVNPVAMESLLNAHPDIRSVLVVGQARFQTALLIEAKVPPAYRASKEKFIEGMWPTVQQANQQCDAHARLSRDLILFTSPKKPFHRAGKGTVQRRVTVDSYQFEIDQAYEEFERLTRLQEPEAAPANDRSLDSLSSNGNGRLHTGLVEDCLVGLVCRTTGWTRLDTSANFFNLGMDSLQVINLVRAINSSQLGTGPTRLAATPKTIYANPTISMLKRASVSPQQPLDSDALNDNSTTSTSVLEVGRLLTKYSWDLPTTCRLPIPQTPSNAMYVLLTGSTGSLGSYILGDLLKNLKVAHVYCVNRSWDSEERQRTSNLARGITADWSSHRVSFLRSDLSQEYLGVGLEVYKSLLRNVTHIVHNAWEVNFNLPVTSFETPHLLGIRQFIDFSARSAKGASILFVSSISSSMNWPFNHTGPVPERIIDDPSASLPMGYAQSKHVAERLLSRASSVAGIPTIICRVGQVAGPVNTNGSGGFWNKQEWLPSLIASSKYLRKIPESLGPSESVDWIPVDILSRVLMELLAKPSSAASNSVSTSCKLSSHNEGHDAVKNKDIQTAIPYTNGSSFSATSNSLQHSSRKTTAAVVYHLVNPHHTTWSNLLRVVKVHFGDTAMETVSLKEWVETLSQSAACIENININPAIRLLDFYENLVSGYGKANPVFETKMTVGQSEELAGLEAVKLEWMELWLEQWGFQ